MFITNNSRLNNSRLPIFYKTFKIEKNLAKCELNISALGIFNKTKTLSFYIILTNK